MNNTPEPCRLYLITPPQFSLPAFAEQAKAALDGGDVACFQLRMKEATDAEILAAGEILLPLCDERGIPFILNDRPDLAKKLGADGVHVGYDGATEHEGMIATIRQDLGEDAIIGVSCYDSRDLAMIAADEGADYVSFGAFFPTKTKIAKGAPQPELLTWWSSYTQVPVVAIGGINAHNCASLVEAGADFLAVISTIWEHAEGPARAVAEIGAAIEKAVAKRNEKR